MEDRPPVSGSDSNSRIVMLAFGPMQDNGHYWCYVAVKPSRYEEFQKSLSSGNYSLYNFEKDGFGEVIVSGKGVAPPEEVTHKVAQMFSIPVDMLFKDNDPKKTLEDHFGVLIFKDK